MKWAYVKTQKSNKTRTKEKKSDKTPVTIEIWNQGGK